ncbi:hypothetical protein NQ318_018021 [Aromia moschata]|uniref:Amine oxidase domain-containing protein n=1 Tax=Aromia moschata TaxID=1265417 RepID=A0AAV8ZEF4_9CUCU|nr:hypothetical protein NQ318_018021 [Aromia moschata]
MNISIVSQGSLPGVRQGMSGAGAGHDSMRDVGGRQLRRRAPVIQGATAPNPNSNSQPNRGVDDTRRAEDYEAPLPQGSPAVRRRAARRREDTRRLKWTVEMYIEVMRTFYIINHCRDEPLPGWRHLLHAEFLRRNTTFNITEQNIVDRKNVIVRKRYLTDLQLQEVKREVGQILYQQEEFQIQPEVPLNLELNGQQVYTPNPNRRNKNSDAPMWRKRLEKNIDEHRADADVLNEFLAGNNSRRVMAKTQAIARKAQIDLNNADHRQQLLNLKDLLRQKAKAKGARLRRYNKLTKRKQQNAAFENNQKQFLRSLEKQDEEQPAEIDPARFTTYWNSIWIIRLYLPRRRGGRGLLNIKNQCLNQEASLRRKILNNRDPLITAIAREDAGYTPLSLGCELIPVDKKIPDITKQLPMDDKILLNKEVTEIKWNSDSDAVKITCVDGSSYDANHVIVTVSLGVLKKNYKTMFVPELPSYKINSIEGIGFGTVNKILLKFPTKWWPDDLKGFSLLWTEEDRINLVNECPHFGPVDDEGRSWLEDVYGFYVIDSNPKVLLGWVVGKMAAEVEYLSDEVVTSSCMYLLKKFVGNKYDIPAPDGVLRSKWSSNQHFCGSYAHINIETEKRKASAEDLARPLTSKNNNPIVQFAGEATNATKFSTVNGAIETGYREAERLINLYK